MQTSIPSKMLWAIVLAGTLGTTAATNISAKYDGTYSGALSPNGALSTGTCAFVDNLGVTIARGMLKGTLPPVNGSTQAIVTEDGFVTGRIVMNGKSYPLEGRITDGTLLAGLFTGDCAWVLKLAKKV